MTALHGVERLAEHAADLLERKGVTPVSRILFFIGSGKTLKCTAKTLGIERASKQFFGKRHLVDERIGERIAAFRHIEG